MVQVDLSLIDRVGPVYEKAEHRAATIHYMLKFVASGTQLKTKLQIRAADSFICRKSCHARLFLQYRSSEGSLLSVKAAACSSLGLLA